MIKQPGVCYAVTDEGVELPVVDVTHPAFAVRADPTVIETAIEQWVRAVKGGVQMPAEAMQTAARQSVLIRGTLEARGTFMSGMTTYLFKLGPENLGDYASEMDRAIAGNIMGLSLRLRLPRIAGQIARGLAAGLSTRTGPVHVLNLGGGTAADSLNALILLQREQAAALAARRVIVHLLDSDHRGPAFAGRALAALRAPGGPLEGVNATLERVEYDWSDASVLERLLGSIDDDVAMAGSSEGGLFEYGSDDQIAENLAALRDRTADDFVMVGSVMHALDTLDPRLAFMNEVPGRPAFRFLGRSGLDAIARRVGWSIACCFDAPVHQVVTLVKR